MTMNHREQQEVGLRESLTNAGIGTVYHYKTLHELFPDLYAALPDIVAKAREGRGLVISGDKSYDAMALTARALQLKGISCQFVQLTRLVRWLEVDREDAARVEQCQCLFVPRFSGSDDSPLANWQRRLVEDFITDRIDNGMAFYAQVSGTLKGSRWWSEEFVERVLSATVAWVCGESRAVATTGAD